MRNVAVLMMSTVRPLELAVYAEVFGTDRSGSGGPRFDFAVASERPGVPVTTGGGWQVTPSAGLDRLARADLVAVAPPAGSGERVSAGVATALRDAVHRGARVMAICSGAYVLAVAGLLDGRTVATGRRYAADLAGRFPRVTVDPAAGHVADDPVYTAAGAAAAIELCLRLVRTHRGVRAAELIAEGMGAYAERRADDPMGELLEWTLGNLHEDLSLDLLARRAFLSRRSFARRFRQATGVSPYAWILEQRVRLAQRLLETEPGLGVEETAGRAGFSSAALLRQHFQRRFGCSPTQYRRRFAVGSPR